MTHEIPGAPAPEPQAPAEQAAPAQPAAPVPEPPQPPGGGWERVRRFVRHPATITVLLVGAMGGLIYGASKINEGQRQDGAQSPSAVGSASPTPTPPDRGPLGVPTSAPRIASETPAPVCQSAEQLGPWPPDASGQFHNIEVDGTQKGAYVEAEMWLPDGPAKTEYWINMSARRVTFKNAAGTAFQWNGNCDPNVISAELAAAKTRRESEEVNVVKLSLADFMTKFPGRVVLMPGDGTTR